jgi:hypothetical protein
MGTTLTTLLSTTNAPLTVMERRMLEGLAKVSYGLDRLYNVQKAWFPLIVSTLEAKEVCETCGVILSSDDLEQVENESSLSSGTITFTRSGREVRPVKRLGIDD